MPIWYDKRMKNTTIETVFSEWLLSAQQKDDVYFEIVSESQKDIEAFLDEFPHKQSGIAMYSFIYKLNFIKNGLVDLCEADNLYAANILYRSFLEHWLKASYICCRVSREKTDDVGNDYLMFCNLGEGIDYAKSVKKTIDILGLEDNIGNIWDTLVEKYPHLESIGMDLVQTKVLQFKHKNIIKYLRDTKAPASEWIHIVISEYSELSSYVHGGPQANEPVSEDERYLKYKGMIKFAYNMCRFYTIYTYGTFAEYNKDRIIPHINNLARISIVE